MIELNNPTPNEVIKAIKQLENEKVEKVDGKGLSTNDFTTAEKNKLAGLNNYNDTSIREDIKNLQDNKADKNQIPTTYLKSASVSNNTLTLMKQDNTTIEFIGGAGVTLRRWTD